MKRHASSGFTLIELLATSSILMILAAVLFQIVGIVSASWLSGRARIDAFSQARSVFEIVDRDLQCMVLRPDLAAFTDTTGAAPALAFYTRSKGDLIPASTAKFDRSVSLVEYRLETSGSQQKLVRCDYGTNYEADGGKILPSFGATTSLPDLGKAHPRDLALGVVRISWKFVDGSGLVKDDFTFDYGNPKASANTRTMRLSLLVMDVASFDLLMDSGKLSQLLAATAGPAPAGESDGEYWERLLRSPGNFASVPAPALKSLRVFERSIQLPLPQ